MRCAVLCCVLNAGHCAWCCARCSAGCCAGGATGCHSWGTAWLARQLCSGAHAAGLPACWNIRLYCDLHLWHHRTVGALDDRWSSPLPAGLVTLLAARAFGADVVAITDLKVPNVNLAKQASCSHTGQPSGLPSSLGYSGAGRQSCACSTGHASLAGSHPGNYEVQGNSGGCRCPPLGWTGKGPAVGDARHS